MEIEIRIVSASYRQSDVAVELFGRTRDGYSVTALYFGFRPYFDVVDPDEAYLRAIQNDPEFVKMEDKKLWIRGKFENVKRIYIRSPWKVPDYRGRCPFEVLAADIPFHHRFIYDFDLGSCVRITGEDISDRETSFTTDMVIRVDKIENVSDFNPNLKVLSFDVENEINRENIEDYGKILVIGYSISFQGKTVTGSISGDEQNILHGFVDLIRAEDPDVITGYNIDGYDIPVIKKRMDRYGIKMEIGRDGSIPRRIMNQFWRVHGRLISDTWWSVKRILHPKHESLDYVANMLLGEGKDNIDRLKIEEEWKNRRDEVIAYCIKDADLTLRIFEKMMVLNRLMYMSSVTKLPLDDVANVGTSNYVDSILIRAADRENIGVPMNQHEIKTEEIQGGYVHTIGAGLYSNVIVLDFKSMYPSMIIKYNVCFTTIDPNGDIESPTGVRFLSPEKRKGLIPRILQDLMADRDDVKRKMKAAKSREEREFYDGIQNAIKVLMNTFYGVLASSFYRFTDHKIGSAITAFARETIKGIISTLQAAGNTVIYGDTDSVFVASGGKSTEEAIKRGKDLSERLSKEQGLTLDFQMVLDPFFSHGAKKRYAGRCVYPEDMKGEIIIKGYEVRRTDSFDLQSQALSKVIDFILNRDIDGAIRYADDLIRKVRSGDPSIDIESLVISRTVKEFDSYRANQESLANIRAAKKLIEMGETFVPGMKVSWIVTNAKRTPQEVEPYIYGRELSAKPDWDYYARRLSETLGRVIDVFRSDLGQEHKTARLDSFEPSTDEKKPKEKETPKNSTLDSFF
ncbi:DNA-directed DNA polymerase [Thermoplasma sp.]|uniref:DNA-directed DNA polymerase n=1 Tax=Thermoplasma sp. TaxID=1973142 RepID=UPI0012857AFE|nr:DNA polymerase II [Thermoplasma sp.]KAA8923150.1 MAG: DNA polymerase II [Thermoplasma sp.]